MDKVCTQNTHFIRNQTTILWGLSGLSTSIIPCNRKRSGCISIQHHVWRCCHFCRQTKAERLQTSEKNWSLADQLKSPASQNSLGQKVWKFLSMKLGQRCIGPNDIGKIDNPAAVHLSGLIVWRFIPHSMFPRKKTIDYSKNLSIYNSKHLVPLLVCPRLLKQTKVLTLCLKYLILKLLAVKHQVFSEYHPESQEALEYFHQTLKTMWHTYCFRTGTEWDEGMFSCFLQSGKCMF